MKPSVSMASAVGVCLLAWAASPPLWAGGPVKVRDVTAAEVLREAHAGRGGVVILHLYASWCPPCRAEMPDINRLRKLYSQAQLKLIPVALDGDRGELKRFLDPLAPAFPALRLDQTEAGRLVHSLQKAGLQFENAVPYTAVFDRQGRLVEQWSGARSLSEYREVINRGLAVRAPASKGPAPTPAKPPSRTRRKHRLTPPRAPQNPARRAPRGRRQPWQAGPCRWRSAEGSWR